MTRRFGPVGALSLLLSLACSTEETATNPQSGGAGKPSSGGAASGGQSGQGGSAGKGGASGKGGAAGAAPGGGGGKSGSSGQNGGGAPSGGQAGQGGAPAGGQAGQGSGGQATGGKGGATGQAGAPSGGQGGGGPAACACPPGDDNFCHVAPGTAGCPMTQKGGYCDPNGDGSYDDADWVKGYDEYQAKCSPGDCGNGVCSNGETCSSCAQDCGACPTVCGNQVCEAGETSAGCPGDCPAPPLQEPDRLLGIHFWDGDAPKKLGTGLYYDVEAFASDVPPSTVVAWLEEREASGARGLVRVDYKWGYSVPKTGGEQAEYNQRLVQIAQAMSSAGLASHHLIVGNETNLPGEGGASGQQAGQAYVSARQAIEAAGPFLHPFVLMPSAPSTAAEFGGGDGSYLKAEMNAITAAGMKPQAIALHAYENPDSDGSGDLYLATITYQAKALLELGLQGIPLFVTEYNMAMTDPSREAAGAKFVTASASRLAAWNAGQEGNPAPGKLFVVSSCYFVWSNDPNWPQHSLQNHPPLRDAFVASWSKYPAGKAF